MGNVLKSKGFAWAAFLVVFALLIVSLVTNRIWQTSLWTLSDELFLFLSMFCLLVSTYLRKMNPGVADKLVVASIICLALSVIAFFVEFVLMQG